MVEGIEEKQKIVQIADLVSKREFSLTQLSIGERVCQLAEKMNVEKVQNFPKGDFSEEEREIIAEALKHLGKEYIKEVGEEMGDIPWTDAVFQRSIFEMGRIIPIIKFFIRRTKGESKENLSHCDESLTRDEDNLNSFLEDMRGLKTVQVNRKRIMQNSSAGYSSREGRIGTLLFESLYYQATVKYCEDYLEKLAELHPGELKI